jgi:hypothetical protein
LGAERFEDCSILYGHRDEIILIKTDHLLDVIVSVDRSGYVLVHELTELRFLRAFQLGTDFEGEQSQQLRLCVHQMGYFIFLDHEQSVWIFKYVVGELVLWGSLFWSKISRSKLVTVRGRRSVLPIFSC